MARPRTVSDKQILDAVRASVLEHGPRVSLTEVANRVGVSQPALFKRFGSRRKLMLSALVPPCAPSWLLELEGGPDARPFAEQLRRLIVSIGRDVEEKMPCLSALRESGIPREEILANMSGSPPVENLRALTRWLERAAEKKQVDPCGMRLESVAAGLIGAVTARFHVQHLLNRAWTRTTDSEFADDVTQMFLRILCPARGDPR